MKHTLTIQISKSENPDWSCLDVVFNGVHRHSNLERPQLLRLIESAIIIDLQTCSPPKPQEPVKTFVEECHRAGIAVPDQILAMTR